MMPRTSTSSSSTSPLLPPYQPPSQTHLQVVPLDSNRALLASLSTIFICRGIKKGGQKSSLNNWFSFRLGRTDVFEHDDTVFQHFSPLKSRNLASRLFSLSAFIISSIKSLDNYFLVRTIFVQAMTSSWYFKGTLRKETQIFLLLNFHSLFCLSFNNFSYTANYLTLAFIMLSWEVQSISRLTTRADALLFRSSLLEVTLPIISSLAILSFKAMSRTSSLNSLCAESDVFYEEWSS